MDRHHVTRPQAVCTARYVFAAYSDDEIEQLYVKGLQGLQLERWSEFTQALLACSLHDELVDDSKWPTS